MDLENAMSVWEIGAKHVFAPSAKTLAALITLFSVIFVERFFVVFAQSEIMIPSMTATFVCPVSASAIT
jgi:hypothetical protein